MNDADRQNESGMPDWWRYHGTGRPHDWELPKTPPWRSFGRNDDEGTRKRGHHAIGVAYRADVHEVELVNAALYLRRPLLVTGLPGVGKSTLAYGVAHELQLGDVLRWNITSRTTLREGLYDYDAMGRLHDMSIARTQAGLRAAARRAPDIGRYVTLGPLGTALLPGDRPRVLLIDEIDKGDIDLPNDLLHAFENGGFEIPELVRLPDEQSRVDVATWDERTAPIVGGRVVCREFPLVIMTSNGERAFPAAFLRRCLRLDMQKPSLDKLRAIVDAHLGPDPRGMREDLIREFADRIDREHNLASDQLLNALVLAAKVVRRSDGKDLINREILRPLDGDRP